MYETKKVLWITVPIIVALLFIIGALVYSKNIIPGVSTAKPNTSEAAFGVSLEACVNLANSWFESAGINSTNWPQYESRLHLCYQANNVKY